MSLDAYFLRPDTPMRNSPAGKLMCKILAHSPDMDMDRARDIAHECLLGMGGASRIQDAYARFLRQEAGKELTKAPAPG